MDERLVVVAADDHLGAALDEVHALERARAVADDVAQAAHVADAERVEVGEDGRERLEVRVDVGDHGVHGVLLARPPDSAVGTGRSRGRA